MFKRLTRIFNLATERPAYQPKPDDSAITLSEDFFVDTAPTGPQVQEPSHISVESSTTFETSEEDEQEGLPAEEEQQWSTSTERSPTLLKQPSTIISKTPLLKSYSSKTSKTVLTKSTETEESVEELAPSEIAYTDDDIEVQLGDERAPFQGKSNPHFHLLYCNKSETDMITWKSKYKQKTMVTSASDEINKKAEIMTKKIVQEFYDWWTGLGTLEFKTEIKRPEDLEQLFQVWFDEQASRGLVLDPKILPCVLKSIADSVGVPEAACSSMLQRHIGYDIHAEYHPRRTTAFSKCLPQKMKHLPPTNHTERIWYCVKIPEDLRSMSCAWDDIMHLTSTNSFQKWLRKHPHKPMPPCLNMLDKPQQDKKQGFAAPSDFVVRDGSAESTRDLAFPVSLVDIELKDVLSKLMNT